ncbi:MAG TPA: SurA N-terminal domain-containing protein [Pseudogracilibacillus sp.]|nr:SurA N-terminal domain-containing protein [Pseudogracilibacillus sp.]
MTVFIALLTFLLLLAACGSDGNNNSNNGEKTGSQNHQENVDIDEDELAGEDEIVAVVNDTDILGSTYNMVYTRTKTAAVQMGEDVDIDEMKKATLDSIIDRELLMQQASKEDIKISDDRLEEELSKIKESGTEDIDTLLEQYDMTEDDFKEQLRFDLTLDQYKDTLGDLEVTEEELEDYYDQVKEKQEDVPPLEEIKPQFKQEAQEKKVMDTLQDEMDELREEADIEKKMEI